MASSSAQFNSSWGRKPTRTLPGSRDCSSCCCSSRLRERSSHDVLCARRPEEASKARQCHIFVSTPPHADTRRHTQTHTRRLPVAKTRLSVCFRVPSIRSCSVGWLVRQRSAAAAAAADHRNPVSQPHTVSTSRRTPSLVQNASQKLEKREPDCEVVVPPARTEPSKVSRPPSLRPSSQSSACRRAPHASGFARRARRRRPRHRSFDSPPCLVVAACCCGLLWWWHAMHRARVSAAVPPDCLRASNSDTSGQREDREPISASPDTRARADSDAQAPSSREKLGKLGIESHGGRAGWRACWRQRRARDRCGERVEAR